MKFDETELRQAVNILKPDNQLFEIRFIGNSGKLNFSGYFTSADTLVRELFKLNPSESGNVYITLNNINSACYSRQQRDIFVKNCKVTTSDNDIFGYDWLMLDFDPKRPSGTSSSDAELEIAHQKAVQVYKYLNQCGFNQPIVAVSGNGYHLLYKIRMQNTTENSRLIENTLKTLNTLFSENNIDIDTKVYNPSRICKLYGTVARKGANTPERPHRLSKIISMPNEIKVNSKSLLESIVKIIPTQPETPQKYNNYSPNKFELENWLTEHNINITQKSNFNGGTKYILENCPFDSNHNGKDACLIKLPNGAICFHCFHQSCSDKKWKDFRELFEPDAYQKKEYHQPNHNLPDVPSRTAVNKPIFLTPEYIRNMPSPPEEFIKTGIYILDKKLRGLKKGFVTCLSGLRASGKSSLISQIAIESAQQNYRTALYSGELTPKNLLKWLVLQSAGKENVYQTGYENYYLPKPGVEETVCKFLEDKIFLYNNDYGNKFEFVIDNLQKCVDEHKVDLIILDNLMTLDISSLDYDFYQRQSKFVGELEDFAKKNNIHIIFVAHPRKSQGFLRLDDISGSNDIVNRVDNAIIMHRVNTDFQILTKQTLHWKQDNPIYDSTNVIEVCKDRDGGVQDLFIPLYFEIETKRLKNNENENKFYGDMENIYEDLPF